MWATSGTHVTVEVFSLIRAVGLPSPHSPEMEGLILALRRCLPIDHFSHMLLSVMAGSQETLELRWRKNMSKLRQSWEEASKWWNSHTVIQSRCLCTRTYAEHRMCNDARALQTCSGCAPSYVHIVRRPACVAGKDYSSLPLFSLFSRPWAHTEMYSHVIYVVK